MVGRSDGFCNDWMQAIRVENVVFLEKSPDATSSIQRIGAREMLPLLLAQTMLTQASMTLHAVPFAEALLGADIPIFKLTIGAEAYAPAFDLMIDAIVQPR